MVMQTQDVVTLAPFGICPHGANFSTAALGRFESNWELGTTSAFLEIIPR